MATKSKKAQPETADNEEVEAYRQAVEDFKNSRAELKKLVTQWKNDVKSSRFMGSLSEDDQKILRSAHAAAGRLTAAKSQDS